MGAAAFVSRHAHRPGRASVQRSAAAVACQPPIDELPEPEPPDEEPPEVDPSLGECAGGAIGVVVVVAVDDEPPDDGSAFATAPTPRPRSPTPVASAPIAIMGLIFMALPLPLSMMSDRPIGTSLGGAPEPNVPTPRGRSATAEWDRRRISEPKVLVGRYIHVFEKFSTALESAARIQMPCMVKQLTVPIQVTHSERGDAR
jgi:hypothetical protein